MARENQAPSDRAASRAMRIEVGILFFAALVGIGLYVVGFWFGVVGVGLVSLLILCLPIGIGLILCNFTLMAHEVAATREFVKQIATWLGIVILLPLVVWYGTSVFSPPPDWKQHSKSMTRLQERIQETKEETEKENLRQEKDRLEKELEDAERVFYRAMFWVAYPLGLVAFVLGVYFPVQAVGAGLMFGGLIALATGCYSYWDRMDDWLRFASLLLALAVVLALGAWRFRPLGSDRPSS